MMIGLYILSTTILKQLKTIKFGMSMRLNQRLFDYLIVFGDSTYEYYYEFENIYTREEILSIESEILCLHEKERNLGYQTEYFYCDNIESFHKGVILLLDLGSIGIDLGSVGGVVGSVVDSVGVGLDIIFRIALCKRFAQGSPVPVPLLCNPSSKMLEIKSGISIIINTI